MTFDKAIEFAQKCMLISDAFCDNYFKGKYICVSHDDHLIEYQYTKNSDYCLFSNKHSDSEFCTAKNYDFFNYCKDCSVTRINRYENGYQNDYENMYVSIDTNEIMQDWTEELYFQKSTVQDMSELFYTVVYWYLNTNYDKRLYIDLEHFDELYDGALKWKQE